MSNNSKVTVLGAEFTRFVATCGDQEFYFSEQKDDIAISKALAHFPSGKVSLGIQDVPASMSDITDLRAPKGWDVIEA